MKWVIFLCIRLRRPYLQNSETPCHFQLSNQIHTFAVDMEGIKQFGTKILTRPLCITWLIIKTLKCRLCMFRLIVSLWTRDHKIRGRIILSLQNLSPKAQWFHLASNNLAMLSDYVTLIPNTLAELTIPQLFNHTE